MRLYAISSASAAWRIRRRRCCGLRNPTAGARFSRGLGRLHGAERTGGARRRLARRRACRRSRRLGGGIHRGRSDSGSPFELEYRLRRHDGAYRWVLDSGRPRFDADAAFLGYVGSLIDITERKRSELLDQEQKRILEIVAAGHPIEECLRALTEATSRLVPGALASGVVVEPDRHVPSSDLAVFFPPAIGEALGDEPIDDRACHSTPVFGRGGSPIAAFRLWLPEPRQPTEWEVRVGEFGARAASIVLERERAAAALIESDTRFRVAADAAQAVVYDVDVREGGPGLAEVHGLAHIVGGPAHKQLTSSWWNSQIHPDDRKPHEALVARCVGDTACSSYRSEYRVRHVDGSWRNVEDCARILRGRSENATRIVGTIRDVTALKQNRARSAPQPRAARDIERYRSGADLLRRRGPPLSQLQRVVLEVVRFAARANRRPFDGRGARRSGLAHRRPSLEKAFAGEPSEYEAEVDYRHGGKRWIHARYTPHRDDRRRGRRRRVPRHGHLGTQASGARARSARRDRRLVRRRDRQQESRRHHHELERRRRALVRLQRRGGRRAADHDADPSGSGATRSRRSSSASATAQPVPPYETDSSAQGRLVVRHLVGGLADHRRKRPHRRRFENRARHHGAQTRRGGRAPQPRGVERPHRPRAVRHLHRRLASSRSRR